MSVKRQVGQYFKELMKNETLSHLYENFPSDYLLYLLGLEYLRTKFYRGVKNVKKNGKKIAGGAVIITTPATEKN